MRGSPGAYAASTPVPNDADRENKFLEQSRLLTALVEQNEALTSRLQSMEHPAAPTDVAPASAPTATVVPAAPVPVPPHPSAAINDTASVPTPLVIAPPIAPAGATEPPAVDDTALFVPNAEGVIDLTTLYAPAPGSLPNPFTVRAPRTGAPHELTLAVQGILSGPSPCALVNERVVKPGDAIESLALSRIEPDAIFLKGDEFNLKLPLGDKPVRLRF